MRGQLSRQLRQAKHEYRPPPLLFPPMLSEGEERSWLDEAVLVNPKIVAFGKGKVTEEEGCLSFPGMRGQVSRSLWCEQNLHFDRFCRMKI